MLRKDPSEEASVSEMDTLALRRGLWSAGKGWAHMGQEGVATVLVVDDDPVVRRVLVLQLKQLGYHPIEAGRGREALQLLAQHSVDAVLLDVVMPDINGIDVLLHIKGDESTENIPVLVMTGLADQEMRLTALASGAEELLSKPVDRLELGSRLRNVLKVKTLTDRIRHSQSLAKGTPARSGPGRELESEPQDGACWRAALRAAARSLQAGLPASLMRLGVDGCLAHQPVPRLLADLATDATDRERIAAAVSEASGGRAVDLTATLERLGPCTVRIEPVWAASEYPEGLGFSLPVSALVALVLPLRT